MTKKVFPKNPQNADSHVGWLNHPIERFMLDFWLLAIKPCRAKSELPKERDSSQSDRLPINSFTTLISLQLFVKIRLRDGYLFLCTIIIMMMIVIISTLLRHAHTQRTCTASLRQFWHWRHSAIYIRWIERKIEREREKKNEESDARFHTRMTVLVHNECAHAQPK